MTGILRRWRDGWRAQQQDAALARRPISDKLWRRTLKRFPFLVQGEARDEARLRRLTRLFLDSKEFSGAHGLQVTDDMAVAIAAQACLPVLHLGLEAYDSFVGIVVHPGPAKARRERLDADGVVHQEDEILSGEAVEGGPVMLSWRDVRAAGATASTGYNVVIHEFAHVLDLTDGFINGRPALPGNVSPGEWEKTMTDAYDSFCKAMELGQETTLDPYGSVSPAEFFAVASEAFFVDHTRFKQNHPQLCELLAHYFGPIRQRER